MRSNTCGGPDHDGDLLLHLEDMPGAIRWPGGRDGHRHDDDPVAVVAASGR